MWHLKTRLGTFWVIPLADVANKFYLGVNEQELGVYNEAEQAARDVHDQLTGYYRWDCQPRVRAPEHIAQWAEGEPQNWETQH